MIRNELLSSVLSITLLGCGGAASSSEGVETEAYTQEVSNRPVHKTGGSEVTATFGPAGGSLELSNGVRVEVPEGTVQEATDVVLKVAPITTVFKNEEYEKAVGPNFLITPDLTAPEGKSLVISILFSAFPEGFSEENLYLATEEIGTAHEQRAFGENSQATRWEYRKVTFNNGRAVAQLDALSGMRLQFVLSK
jgi:hypothetical protein